MRECQLCKRCYSDSVATCPDDGLPTAQTLSGEPVLEGKYQLEVRLGQGGMGVVYRARHAYLKTRHAIKVILPDLVGNDPQLVTRFRQEALAAAAIRHQNVVGVSDYGVMEGKVPFLVMEYVEGESLHDLITREKRLSPEKALELMTAICAGVGAAHAQGIVHRDLKPLNIMICSDKRSMSEGVKILDFGLAKIKSGELLGSFVQAQTTGLMGSPYYMAPEQWADEEPDARSDVYSLGVMLFQMLAGDVPFKGSSIPAIMKKHLSDPAPTFAEMNVTLPPQIEFAVRHTLEKSRETRTQNVEQLVSELARAVHSASLNVSSVGYSTNASMPAAPLRILTNPAQSQVFIDHVAVGVSQPDGWLLLEGVQSGNHRLKVSHQGFDDWESELVCDGKPQQIAVRLNAVTGIPRPAESMPGIHTSQPGQMSQQSQMSQPAMQQSYTVPPVNSQTGMNQTASQQQWQTAPPVGYTSAPVSAKSGLSTVLIAIFGIGGLLLLISVGLIGAWQFGVFGGDSGNGGNQISQPPANNGPTPVPIKADMVKIPGGKFTMGRNGGLPNEEPEHEIEIKDFWLDRTEVTNAEYYEFVKESGYNPPRHFENGKPISGDMNAPVRFVSIDDVNAFAAWRSKRDNVEYRLPTEQEWEYAARNGSQKNLYPWGDRFEEGIAVINRSTTAPEPVATKPESANKWGVHDLIGNVWEWTGSKAYLYPGSKGKLEQTEEPHYMVRGGSAEQKATGRNPITSSFRADLAASRRDATLGFRLARSD